MWEGDIFSFLFRTCLITNIMSVPAIGGQVFFMDADPLWDLFRHIGGDFLGHDLGVGLEGHGNGQELIPEGRRGRDKPSDQVTLIRVLAQSIKFLGQVKLNVLGLCDLNCLFCRGRWKVERGVRIDPPPFFSSSSTFHLP